jgi:hypothetical protein
MSSSASELLLDDDSCFPPSAWDLAMAIGLEADEDDRTALDALTDAMLVWAEGPEVERITDHAVERIWTLELAAGIRGGLLRVAAHEEEGWRTAGRDALTQFDRSPQKSEVARAVVQRLAMQLSQSDHSPFFCASCLDDAVAAAPREARRSLALQIATVARRDADISDGELRLTVAEAVSRPAVERLGTAERRAAVRARLGRIGSLGGRSIPALAAELQAIAHESLPSRPEEDDVWSAVCEELLVDVAQPDYN